MTFLLIFSAILTLSGFSLGGVVNEEITGDLSLPSNSQYSSDYDEHRSYSPSSGQQHQDQLYSNQNIGSTSGLQGNLVNNIGILHGAAGDIVEDVGNNLGDLEQSSLRNNLAGNILPASGNIGLDNPTVDLGNVGGNFRNNGNLGDGGLQLSASTGNLVNEGTTYTQQNQQILLPQPYPVPVYVNRPYAVPITVLRPVDVPRPVQIDVPHPVKVYVDKPYPVHVNRPVPVPVKTPVYVKIPKLIPVRIPKPYPVEVRRPVQVPVRSEVVVKVPVPVLFKETYNHNRGYNSGHSNQGRNGNYHNNGGYSSKPFNRGNSGWTPITTLRGGLVDHINSHSSSRSNFSYTKNYGSGNGQYSGSGHFSNNHHHH